jgi:hypothetical protein
MTAATTTPVQQPLLHRGGRLRARVDLKTAAPTVFVLINAIAFCLIRPDVNDLWAARARASAVSHGVGLTYWFSWFGGGSTPGNYSVVTPYLCAAIGTELVGALSAVAVMVLITVLVRGTVHPVAASCVAAIFVASNLWSGRVPFLLGAAIGVGALIAMRRGHRSATVGLTVLSILASPVSGAFIALGLSGTFLTTRTKAYRPIIAYAVIAAVISLALVGLVFGAPGPEPFSNGLLLEVLLGQAFLWIGRPPDHIRTTLALTMATTVVVWAIPNGLGSNVARFGWFCLPVALVALTKQRTRIAVFAVTPAIIMGMVGTVTDLLNAAQPVSSVGYYTALTARLDKIPDLGDYRVEVVNHGAHAGYDALLNHAMLARGWETQEDYELNRSLTQNPLDPVTYKVWLDNNAVGYVALPTTSTHGYPEYTLVEKGSAKYLHEIWHNDDWRLFRVSDPTTLVGAPATIVTHDQKSMTIKMPCKCTISVRVRWSKFLTAELQTPDPSGPGTVDATPKVQARVADDGSGWTTVTSSEPGTYMLRGSLRGGLFR